jgi:hypothetical protein
MQVSIPDSVIQQYPARFHHLDWKLQENSGFSGARIWKGCTVRHDEFALRRWPSSMTVERLRWIQSFQRAVTHYHWTPIVILSDLQAGFVQDDGWLWHLETWLPGKPDFQSGDQTFLMRALHRIHGTWHQMESCRGPMPGYQRRLHAYEDCMYYHRSGGRSRRPFWGQLIHAMEKTRQRLNLWSRDKYVLQPIFGDLHREHLLYTEDGFQGFIDFGQMRIDAVASEIARVVGSLFPLDQQARRQFVFDYHQGEWEVVDLLDRTGVLVSLFNWIKWTEISPRDDISRDRAEIRIEELHTRFRSMFENS